MSRSSDWPNNYADEWQKLAVRADTLLTDRHAEAVDIALAARLWSAMQLKIDKRLAELDPDGSGRRAVTDALKKRYGL